MNSKTLFKASQLSPRPSLPHSPPTQFERKNSVGRNRKPVMVHINYHPDKARTLRASWR